MRICFLYLFSLAISTCAKAQNWQADATPLHRAQQALTDIMVHDIFSPPQASRVYVYASMAAYETLAASDVKLHSLYGQIEQFPLIPKPNGKIIPSLAATYACLMTGKQLVFSEPILQDSITAILGWYGGKKIDTNVFNHSLIYGQQVADSMAAYIAKDHYKETRKIRRYKYSKDEGKWIPTPPGYIAAVEPYWSQIRTIALDSASQFPPVPSPAFSKASGTPFYRQAYEVYTTGNTMNAEQKFQAAYWDCNPFNINVDGHLNYATKKISPGGHWMSIAGETCRQTHSDITRSAVAYTLVSIALFDAFISCWDEKYRSNVIRPETYINAYIDESWRPFLQTPPFPEYTSGHSVISSASAVILTHLFGDIPFFDSTEIPFGLPTRKFESFTKASNEAAISRLYGGIHYMGSITNGQAEGKQVGEWVWRKIKLL